MRWQPRDRPRARSTTLASRELARRRRPAAARGDADRARPRRDRRSDHAPGRGPHVPHRRRHPAARRPGRALGVEPVRSRRLDRRGRRPYARVFARGARMLQWQRARCYFGAGYLKARGTWLGGDALYETMQLTKFARPLGDAMLAHPELCKLMTFASLATELALPILILSWWRPELSRGFAVAAATALQIGILLMMRVGIFTVAMMAISLVLVPPRWFDRVAAPPAAVDPPRFGRFAAPLAAILVLHLFLVMCSELLPSCPAPIETELQYIGLNQGVDLFTRPIPIASWHAEGKLAAGRSVDIIPIAAPELDPPVGWWFSRWHKFTFKGHIHYPELGAYLCRRYAEVATGPKLLSFTLSRDVTMPHLPGETSPPPRHEVLLEQTCN